MALPKIPVETKVPQPVKRGRLIDAAAELPRMSERDEGAKWQAGVTWQPQVCRAFLTTDVDPCDPTSIDSTPNECETAVEQSAFQFYEVIRGTALQYDRALLEAMLDERGELLTSWALARELAGADASGSAFNLSTEAHAPTQRAFGTAAVPVKEGIAYLVDDLGRNLRGGRGMIHMPPGLIHFADVKEDDDDGKLLETKLGHAVVADAGYVDMPAPSGQAESATGTEWIYSSGPVWYRLSPLRKGFEGDGADNEAFSMARDLLTQILKRFGLLVFDPCAVSAVLVSYA